MTTDDNKQDLISNLYNFRSHLQDDQFAKRREERARKFLDSAQQELQLAKKLNRRAIVLLISATLLFTMSLTLTLWEIWK